MSANEGPRLDTTSYRIDSVSHPVTEGDLLFSDQGCLEFQSPSLLCFIKAMPFLNNPCNNAVAWGEKNLKSHVCRADQRSQEAESCELSPGQIL